MHTCSGAQGFAEADIQSLKEAVALSRQEAVEALRHCAGDLHTAFLNELGALQHDAAALDELVVSYAAQRRAPVVCLGLKTLCAMRARFVLYAWHFRVFTPGSAWATNRSWVVGGNLDMCGKAQRALSAGMQHTRGQETYCVRQMTLSDASWRGGGQGPAAHGVEPGKQPWVCPGAAAAAAPAAGGQRL